MADTATATSNPLCKAGDISSPAARFQSRFKNPAAEESDNKAAQWLMVRIQCQAVVQRCSLGVCSFTNLVGQDGAPSVRKCWLDRRSRSRDEGQQRAPSRRSRTFRKAVGIPTSRPVRAWMRKCFRGTCGHYAAPLPCTRTSCFRSAWLERANHVNDYLTRLRYRP